MANPHARDLVPSDIPSVPRVGPSVRVGRVGRVGPSVRDFLRVAAALLRPVDVAWLVAYRVLFGLCLGVSMQRFLAYGWVDELLVSPRYRFHYWGFSWVEPLSRPSMHALFWTLSALGIAVALGLAYRITAPLFALGLTYVQLIDVSTYLNHYYLAALLAWLLAVSPAARAYSCDAWIGKKLRAREWLGKTTEDEKSATAAFGWHALFRIQIAIVYLCAALAKAQPDWLLHGQPLGIWLGARTDLPVLGRLFTLPGAPIAMSWAGFLFDATIVFWLSWRRSRPYAYLAVVGFHVMTRAIFDIGMFPWIMTCSALLFFPESWPRDVASWLSAKLPRALALPRARGEAAAPPERVPVSTDGSGISRARPSVPRVPFFGRIAVGLGALYVLVQVAMPLRTFLYGGNVLWHEQGMRFSWRVMVRAKGGATTFFVKNKHTGKLWLVSPRQYLTPYQENEMSSQPDLILQLAHKIGEDYTLRDGPVEVRVEALVSLNARPGASLVDPSVDLMTIEDGIGPATWILPAPSGPPPPTRPVL